MIRDRLLDAARTLVEHGDWGSLRLAQVARAAGASRQTVYNEFGTKVGLGRALAEREVDLFLCGLQERMDRCGDDVPAAVEAAVLFALAEGARRPLLKSVLAAGRYADDDLLTLATRDAEPLLAEAVGAVRGYADATWPQVPGEVKDLLVESLMRLTVSHLVAPLHPPEETARRLAGLARRVLGAGTT
ncbi:TetR family transcriptional regulator [Spirillospora sp. CA-253888]